MNISRFLQPSAKFSDFISHQSYILPEITVTPNSQTVFEVNQILFAIYFLVALVFFIRFLARFISILRIRSKGSLSIINGTKVIILNEEIAPFSFMNWIFINPSLHSEAELNQILTHEKIHVNQGHTWDVILSEILTIVLWINPFAWLMKREIRENLEFIADNKVVTSGFDSKNYQYHLLQLSYQSPDLKLTNKFNISPLKKRIKMMNQKKSGKVTATKYLVVLPLAVALILLGNLQAIATVVKNSINSDSNHSVVLSENHQIGNAIVNQDSEISNLNVSENEQTQVSISERETQDKNKTSETIAPPPPPSPKDDNEVFMQVENMPKFPGGDAALFKYLGENIKYPVKAQEKGIQGRVICQFVINKKGEITNVEVIRAVDPNLDAEAIRVINAMPLWEPGTQKGEKVNVKYVLPINFKLQDDKNAKNPWGDKPMVILDGHGMAPNFDYNIIKPESIEKIEVIKADTEESKESLKSRFGKYAVNGVILITTKK